MSGGEETCSLGHFSTAFITSYVKVQFLIMMKTSDQRYFSELLRTKVLCDFVVDLSNPPTSEKCTRVDRLVKYSR